MLEKVKFDCKYFKGYIPCVPNKQRDRMCDSCNEYVPIDKKILIIKLGAIGDVIRTTPLIVRYRNLYPDCHISWLTLFPNILPKEEINEIYTFNTVSIYRLLNNDYDIAINLDKDEEACMLLKDVKAKEKYGFIWKENHINVSTSSAEHKLITGIFDNISKENKKNYLEEIFEICHLTFNKEPYLLRYDKKYDEKWNSIKEKASGKIIIGINTGCGERWKTRLWSEDNWVRLIRKLKEEGFYPVLLGGEYEDSQNIRLSELTGAFYPGHFSLDEFIAISGQCDIIISLVTMMMHIAIGLKKPLVLLNNIFNKHEFELYGNGVIIEPSSGCDCYYGSKCKRDVHCMNNIHPEIVYEAVLKFVK